MYNNFFTISEDLGNDEFFYKTGPNTSILIPNGNYSLTSFNKYLASIPATEKYRVNVWMDGMGYEVDFYASVADRTNDVNRIV